MRMPIYQPQTHRALSERHVFAGTGEAEGLTQQGCDWIACASAVARCIANPNPLECIMSIAPNCRDCL